MKRWVGLNNSSVTAKARLYGETILCWNPKPASYWPGNLEQTNNWGWENLSRKWGFFFFFWDRVLVSCPGWPWTPRHNWYSCLSLLSTWHYRSMLPRSAQNDFKMKYIKNTLQNAWHIVSIRFSSDYYHYYNFHNYFPYNFNEGQILT
jgi:hypothetical protein